jgi:Raf kinase inhibitor-like YbhB/YbcL family protein
MSIRWQNWIWFSIALVIAIWTGHAAGGNTNMDLSSSAFAQFADIPSQYTCDGGNQSPPLTWSGVPADAKSLVLIVDDPDAPDPAAPKMTWVHWVLYNITPHSTGIGTGRSGMPELPADTIEGLNDWKQTGYGGPCPPIGRHRYFHKLYALDTTLPVLHPATKATLEKAMQGHIMAHCELVGYYQKKK